MARLINENYEAGDYLLGLTYTEEQIGMLIVYAEKMGWFVRRAGTEPEEILMNGIRRAAEQWLRNCLRRVKRMLDKDGIELRYIAVTSDMDGETGELVRVHHHLVINREARDAFLEKWTAGGVNW